MISRNAVYGLFVSSSNKEMVFVHCPSAVNLFIYDLNKAVTVILPTEIHWNSECNASTMCVSGLFVCTYHMECAVHIVYSIRMTNAHFKHKPMFRIRTMSTTRTATNKMWCEIFQINSHNGHVSDISALSIDTDPFGILLRPKTIFTHASKPPLPLHWTHFPPHNGQRIFVFSFIFVFRFVLRFTFHEIIITSYLFIILSMWQIKQKNYNIYINADYSSIEIRQLEKRKGK